MKKIIAIILALTIVMSFAACTGGSGEHDATGSATSANVPEADPTVAKYVEGALKLLDPKNLETETYILEIRAEGTSVAFNFIFKEVQGAGSEDLKSALEEDQEKNKDIVNAAIEQIKSEEAAVTSIIYRYIAPDDSIITEFEYEVK